MVTLCDGDLFLSKQPVLVCPANAVGTLGAGLAKAFARRFESCTGPYQRACARGEVTPATPFAVEHPTTTQRVLYVPTKHHWREHSTLARVRACAEGIRLWLSRENPSGVAVPALGCGLGGLAWKDVRPLLLEVFQPCVALVEIYGPLESE